VADGEGTVAGLLDFLAKAGNEGTIARSTADAYASAVRQVFEVTGEGWERTALDGSSVSDHFHRFTALRRTEYKDTTLQSYKSRLYKSVALYERARRGEAPAPRSGRPGRPRQPPLEPARPQRRVPGAERVAERATEPVPARRPAPRPAAQVISHQFPLRPGLVVTVALPTDLSPTEARRVHAFVDALAIEPPARAADATRVPNS
jgi:hypothetical protein